MNGSYQALADRNMLENNLLVISIAILQVKELTKWWLLQSFIWTREHWHKSQGLRD